MATASICPDVSPLSRGPPSGLGHSLPEPWPAPVPVWCASRRIEKLRGIACAHRGEGGDAPWSRAGRDRPRLHQIRRGTRRDRNGPIDILVNNSGVSTTQRIQDVTPEDYDFIFDTNVKGAFFVAQEVDKRMLARSRGAAPGSFTGGRIINIASMAGLKVLPQIGAYCMSKAAVVQMTAPWRWNGALWHQRQRPVPGYIDTEINHDHWRTEQGQKLIAMLPRKPSANPQDLDALIVLLASDQSHFINGAVIAADDGFAV